MPSRSRFRACWCSLSLVVALAGSDPWRARAEAQSGNGAPGSLVPSEAAVARERASGAQEPSLAFRLFLKDGTPVVTLGEYTRAAGRVTFTLPIGTLEVPASLQLVSLPEQVVDWERTSRYTDAVRAKRYAATRGEADFTALTIEAARALTEVAISADPARRLAIAEQARRRLVDWPRTHFAYRAEDVRELALLIDETIAGIRADLGEQSFSFDLVAMTEPPSEPILPEPTLQESIGAAMAVATLSDVPTERMPLQQAILAVLESGRANLPRGWAADGRRALEASLRADQRIDLRYAQLVKSALDTAASRADRHDVEGLSRLLDEVRREDARLGHERPGQMTSLVATIESYSRIAARRRTEQQRLAARAAEHQAYRDGTSRVISGLREFERDLTRILDVHATDRKRMTALAGALDAHAAALVRLTAPAELVSAHETLLTSIRLMREAARLRLGSPDADSGEAARNASAAVAGSQLLLASARTAIGAFFDAPRHR